MEIKEFFETKLPSEFAKDPGRADGMSGVYVFDISGDGGGQWAVSFPEGGGMSVTPGDQDDAGCKIKVSTDDWNAILGGELDPTTAFMSGKIIIEGDMSMAMKLQPILGAV